MNDLNHDLLSASLNNDVQQMIKLIKAGADVNVRDDFGKSVLWLTVTNAKQRAASLLIKSGANMHELDIFFNACFYRGRKQLSLVRQMINSGADINQRQGLTLQTALIYAVIVENDEMIELLLEKGADIHSRDARNRSALCYAVMNGQKDLVNRLVALSANINDLFVKDTFNYGENGIKNPYTMELIERNLQQLTEQNMKIYKSLRLERLLT
jgi:ankyrin repeat protein